MKDLLAEFRNCSKKRGEKIPSMLGVVRISQLSWQTVHRTRMEKKKIQHFAIKIIVQKHRVRLIDYKIESANEITARIMITLVTLVVIRIRYT